MSGFLDRLSRRTLGEASGLRVRRRARFEPAAGATGIATPVFAEQPTSGIDPAPMEAPGTIPAPERKSAKTMPDAQASPRMPSDDREKQPEPPFTARQPEETQPPSGDTVPHAEEPFRPAPAASREMPASLAEASHRQQHRPDPFAFPDFPPPAILENRPALPEAAQPRLEPAPKAPPVMARPAAASDAALPARPSKRGDTPPAATPSREAVTQAAPAPEAFLSAETRPKELTMQASAPPARQAARPEKREPVFSVPTEVPAPRTEPSPVPPSAIPSRAPTVPQVEVRIGRMEIRAAAPAPQPAAKPQRASALSRLPSLADYLARPRGR